MNKDSICIDHHKEEEINMTIVPATPEEIRKTFQEFIANINIDDFVGFDEDEDEE